MNKFEAIDFNKETIFGTYNNMRVSGGASKTIKKTSKYGIELLHSLLPYGKNPEKDKENQVNL